MIHVVRHANAGSRPQWNGEDSVRPLSEKGRLQSKLLAEALGARGAVPLLASPFTRCLQTLEPLANRFGTAVEAESLLVEGAPPEPIVALISRLPEGAVLCSHGDVIMTLIGHLAASGANLDHSPATNKGATWTLDLVRGRVRAGRYTAPPEI